MGFWARRPIARGPDGTTARGPMVHVFMGRGPRQWARAQVLRLRPNAPMGPMGPWAYGRVGPLPVGHTGPQPMGPWSMHSWAQAQDCGPEPNYIGSGPCLGACLHACLHACLRARAVGVGVGVGVAVRVEVGESGSGSQSQPIASGPFRCCLRVSADVC